VHGRWTGKKIDIPKIWEERVDQVITQDEDELIKDNTRINSSQHLFIRWCCIVGERHSTTHLRTT
jgi:hypothetical protein